MPTVLITGASSGIGRALALIYAAPGTRLLLAGRDAARLAAVEAACAARGAETVPHAADAASSAFLAWVAAQDAHTSIDLAIACAGITTGTGPGRPLERLDATRAVLQTNIDGPIGLLATLAPPMLARRRGHLAVVGSLAGFRGFASSPAYSASKAAVHAYAEGLRPALRRHGVAVTVIAPGFVATPLDDAVLAPLKPGRLSAEAAARRIRRGLDRRVALVAFPWPLYAGLRLLSLLPAAWGDRLMPMRGIDVPETAERAR